MRGPQGMAVPPERTVSAPPAGALLRANAFNNGTLWHAGSGMSVSSDFKVSPAAFNLTEDLEPIQPSVRPFTVVLDDDRCAHACCAMWALLRNPLLNPPLVDPVHLGISHTSQMACSYGNWHVQIVELMMVDFFDE